MHFSILPFLPLLLSTASAFPSTTLSLAPRKGGGPTGGPASAKITIYNAYQCNSQTSAPPIDGSAGTNTTIIIAEKQCAVVPIPVSAAITASLTATPKTGTAGCYVQIFKQQGCGVVLGNDYFGFPFDGTGVGNKVGCKAPVGSAFGAVELVCA